ncbi:MAG: HAMP domain-containing sensor histidine kinase [Polyangiales bacterium]
MLVPSVNDPAPARTAQLRAVGTAFLRQRPWIVAPSLLAQVALLAASDAPRAQVGALLSGFTALLSLFAWEARRGRRALVTAAALSTSLRITLAGISMGAAATGGITSPLLPVLFAPTVVGFAAFGRAREGRALLVALALALLALAALPRGTPFPPLPVFTHRAMSLVAALTAAALLWAGVSSLTDAYAQAGDALSRAGDELLATAESRQRALDDLGAQVAHEIKNPLTAIKGLTDLLAEQAPDPRNARRLAVISDEVARIERILRDYLSFSHPFERVARAPTDLDALLRDLLGLLEVRADRAGITLAAEGAPLRALVDPRRVKEATLNLLLNALDVTPRGGRVTVSWARDGAAVALAVCDDGPGMSPEVLARVGDAYFTTREGGTGLGVRLARRVAEAHGGALVFAPAPGGGTRATLTLGDAAAEGP